MTTHGDDDHDDNHKDAEDDDFSDHVGDVTMLAIHERKRENKCGKWACLETLNTERDSSKMREF